MPRHLRFLLAAEAISSLGSNLSFVALPWFVLATTGSPARMGAVLAAEMLPVALLGIPSGRLASGLGARRTMVAGDAIRAATMALIPALHWVGLLSFGALLALVATLGACYAPYFGSQRALLTELAANAVDAPDSAARVEAAAARAMTLLQGVSRGASLAGPALAGLLLVPLGAPALLMIDAASFALAATLLTRLPDREHARTARAPSISAGVRGIARDPLLRQIAATSTVVEGSYQVLFSALPAFVFLEHRDEPALTGLLVAAWAAGAIAGVGPTLTLLRRHSALSVARWAGIAQAAACWGLVATLPPPAMAVTLFCVGVGNALATSPKQSLFTLRASAGLRTSATTALVTATMLAGAIGIASGGPAVDTFGAQTTFAATATAMTFAAVWFAWRTMRVRAQR